MTMLKSFFFPFIILYLAASCKKEDGNIYPAPNPSVPIVLTDTAKPKSFLALGDSYTIGQSVVPAERYPNQTAVLLLADGVKFSSPEIIAQTGWTTGNLIKKINADPPVKISYDIVTLLIGVNNQYQQLPQSQYRDEFSTLLNTAIKYAGNEKARVFVLSIPDYSVTPFVSGANKMLIASQIDSFNLINKELTTLAGCNYLDITASSRQATTDPGLVATDGLHPSGKEYSKWAILLAPLIKSSLK